jgi:hypothetical protein
MDISSIQRRKTLWIGPLLVALLVTGCAGIKPYEPETGNEAGKRSDETADGEQQKLSSEEKKAKNKSGEQQQSGIDWCLQEVEAQRGGLS